MPLDVQQDMFFSCCDWEAAVDKNDAQQVEVD